MSNGFGSTLRSVIPTEEQTLIIKKHAPVASVIKEEAAEDETESHICGSLIVDDPKRKSMVILN